jgi:hypothetical protein
MTNDKRELIDMIATLLDDPSCEVAIETGVHSAPNYATGYIESQPTSARTVTIRTRGGAAHTFDQRIRPHGDKLDRQPQS